MKFVEELRAFFKESYRSQSLEERAETFDFLTEWTRRLDPQYAPNSTERTIKAFELMSGMLLGARRWPLVYCGRPSWLTPNVLRALSADALDRFEGADRSEYMAMRHDCEIIFELVDPVQILRWVQEVVGLKEGALKQRIALSYLYYDRQNDGNPWHIDFPETHEVNLLIKLMHLATGEKTAHFQHMSEEGMVERRLEEGEAVMFNADCTPHRRTRLSDGEFVIVFSMGFVIEDE